MKQILQCTSKESIEYKWERFKWTNKKYIQSCGEKNQEKYWAIFVKKINISLGGLSWSSVISAKNVFYQSCLFKLRQLSYWNSHIHKILFSFLLSYNSAYWYKNSNKHEEEKNLRLIRTGYILNTFVSPEINPVSGLGASKHKQD